MTDVATGATGKTLSQIEKRPGSFQEFAEDALMLQNAVAAISRAGLADAAQELNTQGMQKLGDASGRALKRLKKEARKMDETRESLMNIERYGFWLKDFSRAHPEPYGEMKEILDARYQDIRTEMNAAEDGPLAGRVYVSRGNAPFRSLEFIDDNRVLATNSFGGSEVVIYDTLAGDRLVVNTNRGGVILQRDGARLKGRGFTLDRQK
jgi:histidine ammonia-lyase